MYSSMWSSQDQDDPGEVTDQNSSHLYTAIGTYGDTLYDVGDNNIIGSNTNLARGVISQMFFTEPQCADNFFDPNDPTQSRCTPTGQFFVDPCSIGANGQVLPTGGGPSSPLDGKFKGPTWGAVQSGTMGYHSVVKNCPGVVQKIMSYVPTSSPSPPTPTPTPTIGYACTKKTFEQLVANPIESEVSPAANPELRCLDGYAVMNFNDPSGQPVPFFFSFTAGKWVLIPGSGTNPPTGPCQVVPHQVMSAWGFNCTSPASSPSPSPTTTGSPTATGVAPGHGSPAAAVAGLYNSELAGDWSDTKGACSYVQPAAQAICASATSGQGSASGSFQIHATVTQGTEALVEVTGTLSAPGSPTVSNSDPSSGMPSSAADFQTVYANLVNSPATIMSPAPCVKVHGQWYAAVGG
jgi:hypothetical protein